MRQDIKKSVLQILKRTKFSEALLWNKEIFRDFLDVHSQTT